MSLLADGLLISSLIVACYLYSKGWRRSRRSGSGGPVRLPNAMSFVVGALVLASALIGPIHGWSEHSLAGHMTQHLMLLVSPLLFVAGRPMTGLSLGLDPAIRGRVARVVMPLRRSRVGGLASRPMAVTLLIVTVGAWHLPALFDLTLRSDAVHALEHVCFFAAAALYWHSLIGEGSRRAQHRGPALVSVFTVMLAGTAFGALLTFARTPWYPGHSRLATAAGLDWLTDQQLAGLVMWVPTSIILLIVFLWLAGTWLSALEKSDALGYGTSP
ncbi:MAG: cytochrome c oxidase assembly protein [Acidimicrobiia bacterium]